MGFENGKRSSTQQDEMNRRKNMKRIISLILVVCVLFSCSIVAVATEPVIMVDTDSYTFNDVEYTVTVYTYSQGASDEYRISSITGSDGSLTTSDSRENYVVEDGVKHYYTVNDISTNVRASRPTAIQHGLSVDTSLWGYISSSWKEVALTDTVESYTAAAFTSLVIANIPGAAKAVTALATKIYDFYQDYDNYHKDTGFWYREYKYGYRTVVSQFAHIRQTYTQNYTVIPGAAFKHNGTPYTF